MPALRAAAPRGTVASETRPSLAVAQDREADASSRSACRAIARDSSAGERTGLPSIATITSVGSSLPSAGKPGSTASTSAPVVERRHLRPSARSATAAAICCEVAISESVDLLLLGARDARRDDLGGRVEVGAALEAAEELLEQRRLADDHVDEVDAAAVVRVVAAGDVTSGATGWARSGRKM